MSGGVLRVALASGRVVVRLLPRRLRRILDDRFFGAVFQVTRVTNDHYGWRPEAPAGRPGEAAREPTG